MNPTDKPLIWLKGEIKIPPMGKEARIEAGYLLRSLQAGLTLAMPHSPDAVCRATLPRTEGQRRYFHLEDPPSNRQRRNPDSGDLQKEDRKDPEIGDRYLPAPSTTIRRRCGK